MQSSALLRVGSLVVLALFACMVARHWFIVDDAYICLRYAQNFAEGHGLVFNLGERVEGYSGLLWVVWLGLAARLGADLETVAQWTLVVGGASLVVVTMRAMHRQLGVPVVAALTAGLFVALSPPVAQWSSSGMEAVLAALAAFIAAAELVLRAERPRTWIVALALVTLALLRIDGVGFGALLLIGALPRMRASRAVRDAALIGAACMVLAVLAQMVWRHAYYGDWAPHTARIKAGFSVDRLERGALYVGAFFLANPVFVLAAALAPWAWSARRDVTFLALTMCAGVAAHSAFVGGDWMPFFRFFVMAIPFAALVVGLAVARAMANGWPRRAAAIVVAVAALAPLSSFDVHVVPRAALESCWFRWSAHSFVTEAEELHYERELGMEFDRLGNALAQFTKPGDSMIASAAGAIGFRSRLHLYDTLGLVSPELLRHDVPVIRANAGHDRVLSMQALLSERPTLAGTFVLPSAMVEERVEHGRSVLAATGLNCSVERHALPADPTVPGAFELVLLRIREP